MNYNLTTLSRLLMVVFLLTAGLAIPSSTASANVGATFTVNSNADTDINDGFCTLREAIHAADVNLDYNGCIHTGSNFGDELIVFSISGNTTITLDTNLPNITGNLTIDGSNSGRPVVIDGATHYRAFNIMTIPTVTLQKLTVQNGNVVGSGGGVVNTGTLYVLHSSFLNNVATQDGGAINNTGTVTIANSTFSGNSAAYGGGIANNSGTATILNSTFSGNIASYGGALSTWKGGSAAPVTTVKNTILANSIGSKDCGRYGSTGTMTGNHNIVETTESGSGSCSGITTSTADPKLDSRTGLPSYFPLLSGSPALDAGSDTVCAAAPVNKTSENGRSRPQGSHCDIGAYEMTVTLTSTIRSVGGNDGWVLESSETSGVGGSLDSAATTFRLGDNATKKQFRGVLSFGTGALPDNAVITKVTLKLTKQGVIGGGNPVTTFQGFMLDIKKGFFGATALQTSDFQAAASHSFGPISPALVGGAYRFDLTSRASYINKAATNSGLTQIRVRFKLDDNNNAFANYLSLYSGNYSTASARPALIVQYYVP